MICEHPQMHTKKLHNLWTFPQRIFCHVLVSIWWTFCSWKRPSVILPARSSILFLSTTCSRIISLEGGRPSWPACRINKAFKIKTGCSRWRKQNQTKMSLHTRKRNCLFFCHPHKVTHIEFSNIKLHPCKDSGRSYYALIYFIIPLLYTILAKVLQE